MDYPVDAFTGGPAEKLQPGTFYFDSIGQWFLAVKLNGRRSTGALRLTGRGEALAGSYISEVSGDAFSVDPPYHVQICVDSYANLRKDGPYLGTILLGRPNIIFSADEGRAHVGFDGFEKADSAVTSGRWRYSRWCGWLIDERGQRIGSVPLFTVEADSASET